MADPRSEGDRRSINRFWTSHFDQEKMDPPLDAKLFQFQLPAGAQLVEGDNSAMADFVLKYADGRGPDPPAGGRRPAPRRNCATAIRQQGFLIYSIKPRSGGGAGGGLWAAEEAESREVPDLQPAVRHADPRRAAHPESAGPAGRPPDRSQTGPLHQSRARRGAQRHAAFRSLPAAGNFPQDLRDLGDGGRKKRQPDGSAGPLHHLSEAVAGGEQEGAGFADVPVRADRAGDRC